MNLWDKIISYIKKPVFRAASEKFSESDASEDYLLAQMNAAVVEARQLWNDPLRFVDPSEVDAFLEKWTPVYAVVLGKTQSLFHRIGFYDRTFEQTATIFLQEYKSLSHKLHQHNENVAALKIDNVGRVILPVEGRTLDRQQLLCIAKEAHSHLVLAGAGTVKTTTIVGYIKYYSCRENAVKMIC